MSELQSDPQWWARVVELYDDSNDPDGSDDSRGGGAGGARSSAASLEAHSAHRQRRSLLRSLARASLIALPLAGAWLEETIFPAAVAPCVALSPTTVSVDAIGIPSNSHAFKVRPTSGTRPRTASPGVTLRPRFDIRVNNC